MNAGAPAADRGETLLELLVSVLIMGVAVVALVGGLGTAIRVSDIHRKQANAGAYVRSYAEAIETAVAASPSAYVECAGPAAYESAFTPGDPTYAASVVDVTYWDGSGFSDSCTAGSDNCL
jgi:type II secretory pathway pseudopilin PulG